MSKHMIYLGAINGLHRVAYLDTDNLPFYKVPVKDTPILPDAPFLNCEVNQGKALLSVQGAIPIESCTAEDKPQFIGGYSYSSQSFNEKDLWVRKNKAPQWRYWHISHSSRGSNAPKFYCGPLLPTYGRYRIWDGTCRAGNWYVLAMLFKRRSKKKHEGVGNYICVSSEGVLGLFSLKDMSLLIKTGCRLVLAGSPELQLGDRYEGGIPALTYWNERESEVVWVARRDKFVKEGDLSGCKAIWGTLDIFGKTVIDLRKYASAEVFGPLSIPDARAIVFPDTTKAVHTAFIKECPSLNNVYLPEGCVLINGDGAPIRRIKKIVFHSNSSMVQRYAESVGAKWEACGSPDEFLEKYYAPTDGEYISAYEAASIASLAAARSVQRGAGGTVMSAVLLSIESKGCDYSTLMTRFPVIQTMREAVPEKFLKYGVEHRTVKVQSDLGKELARLYVAGLTQFYPKYDVDIDSLDEVYSLTIGEYTFYYVFQATSKVNDAIGFIAENLSREIVHCFTFDSARFGGVFRDLESLLFFDAEPSGVFRYADKLGVIYPYSSWDNGGERSRIADAVCSSFMPISYGTRVAKSQLFGIDLHTGAFVTASITPGGYRREGPEAFKEKVKQRKWFSLVNRLSDIKLYPMDEKLLNLLPRNCVFVKNGVGE